MPWWVIFSIVIAFIWIYSIAIAISWNWDKVKKIIQKKKKK